MAAWLDELTSARPNSGYGVTFLKSGPAALAAPPALFKPTVDKGKMSVTAVLTTRTPDRQGDIIDPAGGDFAEHESNPVVMFHHGKDHKLPIGKAEDADGNYTVRLVKARDGSDVLLGTTHFSQSDRFANDVFGLVAEDILRGVSIGFDPLSGEDSVDELGPSPVLKRPALHFKGWKLLEYSHTPLGVNRDALTVAVEKALDGSRSMHPTLLKYFQTKIEPRKTIVKAIDCDSMPKKQKTAIELDKLRKAGKRVPLAPVRKAMDDDDDVGTDDTDYNPATDDPSQSPELADAGGVYAKPEDDAPSPTVQAMLDAAQGLMDLCAATEGAMKKSEHMKGRKYAVKLCADLRKTAAEAKSFGEKIKDELSGMPAPGDMEPDGDDTDTGTQDPEDMASNEPDEAKDEPETDDDGAIVTKGYTPKRWTHADLAATGSVIQTAPASARELKSLKSENVQLKKTLENLLNDLDAGAARR